MSTINKIILASIFFSASSLYANGFVIESGQTVNNQTMSDVGDVGIVEVGGTIHAGGSMDGVDMNAADQSLYNYGTIIPGTFATSVVSIADNVLILNEGTISAGEFSNCIDCSGAHAVITNTGLISTSGANGVIISTTGGINTMITNHGIISVGVDGTGISTFASNSIITNTGTISGGTGAVGIYDDTNAANAQITNNGTISLSGNNTTGIFSLGSSATITNTGKLYVAGSNTTALSCGGAGASVTNSGQIVGLTALSLTGTTPSLSLLKTSNIQGSVSVPNDVLALSVQTGLNLALTLDSDSRGFGLLNIEAPYVVRSDPVIAVIDPTGLAMQSDVTADLSDSVLNGLHLHRTRFCDCGLWTEGIGSYRTRNAQPDTLSYTDFVAGLLIGYDTFIANQAVSVFGGCSYAEANIKASPQQANITLGCAGLSYDSCICGTSLSLAVMGGYLYWKNTRVVMNNLASGGMDKGRAYINGGLISADISLGHGFPSLFCHPYLIFDVRYAELFLGNYAETGSLADLTVFDRNVGLITTRLEIAFWRTQCLGFLEPFIGIFGRYQVAGRGVKAELLDIEFRFNQAGPLNLVAGLIGLRGSKIIGRWNSFFNIEASFDNAKSTRILAELGVKF
ncbi:MAG: autotransporter domain-containing protein [Chlamydiales bacterium]|nr:autotransporter domain-containing protein [Chlamydiales bacterium]